MDRSHVPSELKGIVTQKSLNTIRVNSKPMRQINSSDFSSNVKKLLVLRLMKRFECKRRTQELEKSCEMEIERIANEKQNSSNHLFTDSVLNECVKNIKSRKSLKIQQVDSNTNKTLNVQNGVNSEIIFKRNKSRDSAEKLDPNTNKEPLLTKESKPILFASKRMQKCEEIKFDFPRAFQPKFSHPNTFDKDFCTPKEYCNSKSPFQGKLNEGYSLSIDNRKRLRNDFFNNKSIDLALVDSSIK